MKYLFIITFLFLFSCGDYNQPESGTGSMLEKVFDNMPDGRLTKSAKFKVDTVRNPNNGFLYYYIKADPLGYEGQYLVKMEDGQNHLTATVNGKPGYLIWCLENWEYFTDSLERNQSTNVKLFERNFEPK